MELESPVVPTTAEIRVDTPTLRAFGVFMQRELNAAIAPLRTRVHPRLDSGAVVAPCLASGDVGTLNAAHLDCLTAMGTQLGAYEQHLGVLAGTADAVAARYESADTVAGVSLQAIDAQLSRSTTAATPPTPDTPHGGHVNPPSPASTPAAPRLGQ